MSYDVTVGPAAPPPIEPFDGNLTYNLGTMMRRAGIHPEVMDGLTANVAQPVVGNAIAVLEANPEYFEQFNAPNGWGNFGGLVEWLTGLYHYLEQCPDDYVVSWR
jgi:hypothetical protein